MSESCSKRIYDGSFRGRQCSRPGVVEENGSLWCRQHVPSAERVRREASHEKWRLEREEQQAKSAERACQQRLAAHWLEHGPRLLEALKSMTEQFWPCSKPIGESGSIARNEWECQLDMWQRARAAIAAAEQVPND